MRSQQGEQDDIANGLRTCEDHGESVDTDPFAAGGGEAVPQGAHVIFIHVVRFIVSTITLFELILETFALLDGIVELGEGIADFKATDIELESFDPVRIVGRFA